MTRRREDGPKGREAIEEIEARLGELFGKLGESLGALSSGARRDGEADAPVRVHSDVRIRLGGLDADTVAPEDAPAPEAEAAAPAASPAPRAPACEVRDADGAWVLTAELPGASAEDITVSVDTGRLTLTAGGARSYRAELPFPDHADAGRIDWRLANGILELRAPWWMSGGDTP